MCKTYQKNIKCITQMRCEENTHKNVRYLYFSTLTCCTVHGCWNTHSKIIEHQSKLQALWKINATDEPAI